MKYCEDCRWCGIATDQYGADQSVCNNELAYNDGKSCVRRGYGFKAKFAREPYGKCGIEGKLWEGKE